MIPKQGTVLYLVECRNCRKREILATSIFKSYRTTVRAIRESFENGLTIIDHADIAPGTGCNNLAVFDLIAVSRKHEEDPD